MAKQIIDGCTAATYAAYALSEIATIYPITPVASMGETADKWGLAGRLNLMGNTMQVKEMESEIVGLLFHMDPLNLKMLVVACALPPAFSGIIISDEYDVYVATGTSSLTLSVILFVAFCPLWIWLTDLALKAF